MNSLLPRRCLTGLLLILFFGLNLFSAESPGRKIRVGYGALPGYHEQTADGRRSGYGYDYLQKIAARAGWECEYVGYDKSWGELLAMLERGEVDLLSCVNRTPEREQKFAFSESPIGISFANVTVRMNDSRFSPRDYLTWNGMRVGMVSQNWIDDRFAQWAKDGGITYTPVFFDTDKACHDALMAGKIDAMVSINFRRMENECLLERLFPDPVYFAVRRDNTSLLEELNQAQSQLEFENPTLNAELIQRYYKQSIVSFLQKKERRFIADAEQNGKVFRALLDPGRFPLSFLQHGKPCGIQYDVLCKILDHSGLKFQIVTCRDHAEYARLRQAGDFDVILDFGGSLSRAEKQGLYLSDSYLSTPISILMDKQHSARTGKIALPAGSTLPEVLRDNGLDLENVVYLDSIDEIVQAVKDGRVDSAYLHTRTCNEILRLDQSGRLASILGHGLRVSYSMAVKRTAPPELLNILNQAVSALPDSEINDSIADYAFNPDRGFHLRAWLEANPLKGLVAMLILLSCVTAVFLFILIARRNSYRNAKILEKLPLRFFVADRNGRLLLLNTPDLPDTERKNISELAVPEVTRIMKDSVAEAFQNGVCRIDYNYEQEKRSAVASRLPASIFGRDAVVWISQDTTALHDAQTKAEDLAIRMRLKLKSIGDAVMATDAEGRITLMNPSAEKFCGISEAEAHGKKHEDCFRIVNYETGLPVPSPVRHVLETGETVELANHTDLIALDGTRRHIADSAAPIPGPDGRVNGAILVFRDVTGEYDKRDQLRRAKTLLELGAELTNSAAFEYDLHANSLTGSQRLGLLWPRDGERPIDRKKWVIREDLSKFNRAFHDLRKEKIETVELDFRSGYSGELRNYSLKGRLDKSDSQNPKIVGVLRDITRQTAFLRMELARSRALEVFFYSPDIRTAFAATLNILAECTGAVFGCVLSRKDRESMDMELFSECRAPGFPAVWPEHETIHFDPKWRGQQLLLQREGIVQCPDLEISSDLADCQVVKRLHDGFGIKAVFLTGIYHGNKLWGELGIAFNAPQRQYDDRHKEFLLSFAHLLEMMLDRSDMENKLRESLTTLELASEMERSAAIVYDVDRNIMSGSRQLDQLWPRRDGKFVLIDEWIHPSSLPAWKDAYQRLLSGESKSLNLELRTNWFGKRRFYSVRGTMTTSEWGGRKIIGVLTDVTDPKGKLLNEQHLNRCLEILFNPAPDIDAQREMLKVIAEYMEASRCEIVQMDFADNSARAVSEYYTPEAGPLMMSRSDLCFKPEWEAVKNLLNRKSVLLDDLDDERQLDKFPFMRILRRERDFRSIFMTGVYIDGGLWGEIEIGYENTKAQAFTKNQLGFLRSAAHIVELLLIRKQSDERLKLALAEAQSAAKAKSYFLATMSHEIRTPLNAVIGFAELLKDRSVSPRQQQEYLGDIASAGNALLLLINDVLDLSKLESGQMKFALENTDFPELVREMGNIFKVRLMEKNLTCVTDIQPMPILKTDKLRLRQILFNLVGNAVKFTDRGTVTIDGSFLPATDGRGTLRFSVKDTGCGIPKVDHERVFQPFVQSETLRGTRVGNSGTGLGLAIIQRMLERMNGRILLDSAPGKGSVFTVEINDVPFLPQTEKTAAAAIPAAAETVDPSLRILLVDDVPMNLKVMRAMYGKLGLALVETAGSGADALVLLEKQPFDIVLTDMWMPDMNGAQLAGKIRENKAFDHIRIFAVTADIEAQTSFDLHYFTGIPMKPVTLEKLTKAAQTAREIRGGVITL